MQGLILSVKQNVDGDYEVFESFLFQELARFKEGKYAVSIIDYKEFDQVWKFSLKIEAKNTSNNAIEVDQTQRSLSIDWWRGKQYGWKKKYLYHVFEEAMKFLHISLPLNKNLNLTLLLFCWMKKQIISIYQ